MEISFYFFFREWKLIFKNSVNRNLKKLTVVKKAKILIVNRKIHNPIETLGHRNGGLLSLIYTRYGKKKKKKPYDKIIFSSGIPSTHLKFLE